jgi:DNA polymerase III epsilon subunit-like protein
MTYDYRPWERQALQYGTDTVIRDLNARYKELLVLDTETTGLAKTSEITQIAIVHYPSEEILLNTFVKPMRLKEYDNSPAMKLTGITLERLTNVPTFEEVWPLLLTLINSRMPIAVYNANFDSAMILRSCMASRLKPVPFKTVCVMKLFSAYADSNDNWKLCEALEMMNLPRDDNAHDALSDVMSTIALLNAMKRQ